MLTKMYGSFCVCWIFVVHLSGQKPLLPSYRHFKLFPFPHSRGNGWKFMAEKVYIAHTQTIHYQTFENC